MFHLVIFFGGLTAWFNDERFFKMKPTIIYVLFGGVLGFGLMRGQSYLQSLMGVAAEATSAVPVLSTLVAPERWLLWLGVLFILSVYFFPTGIVGRLRGK